MLALAAAALALTSCRTGFSGGEGPGLKGFVDGELNGNVAGSLDASTEAVLQTLMQMGVLNVDQKRGALLAEIHARTLEDVRLEIKLSHISDRLTKLRIRAGSNDQELARSIFTRVRQRLQVE